VVSFENTYAADHPLSKQLYERATRVFPSGVTHDGRFLRPFPIYVNRAQGIKKWDVNDRAYIDYWMGHGSLILGHQQPDVVNAIHTQIDRGTHYGACHELEVQWGEKVVEMVPSAERVRFVSSGTEATMIAIRLARSYTGKKRIIRFSGHYHGWHDAVCIGIFPPFEVPNSSGIPDESLRLTLVVPPDDLQRLEDHLKRDQDVACVILEPSGGFSGAFPLTRDYLRGVREITRRFGVVLIFDEVITGFRYALGGAQEYFDVTPDLSCLAKILAGGLPGGAVAGREEIMQFLEFREDAEWNRHKKILHYGTFNANPLSAAAGVTTLKILAQGDIIPRANQNAQTIRTALNAVVDQHRLNWCVHGEHSIVHILMNHHCAKKSMCDRRRCTYDHQLVYQKDPLLLGRFRSAMLNEGVDCPGDHWWISPGHSDEVVEKTSGAFDRTIGVLKTNLPDRF
jgi:glutamate-1-semialdehyde 2,1-aminomutase